MLKTLRNWIQNRRKKQTLPIDWFLDEPEGVEFCCKATESQQESDDLLRP